MPNTSTRITAALAIALAAGALTAVHAQASSPHADGIIVAQAGGGTGGSGGAGSGSGGTGGAGGGNDTGRQFNDRQDGRMAPPGASNPTQPQNFNTQSGVPARCASISDPAQRQACINTPQGKSK